MKKLLQLLLCLLSLTAFAQASGSQEVAFKVRFEKDIPVKDIKIYYYETGGSYFDRVHFEADVTTNSISITGYNHYIVDVGIPTFMFVQEEPYISRRNTVPYEVVTKLTCYYLYGDWRCAIGDVPDILFTKNDPELGLIQLGHNPAVTKEYIAMRNGKERLSNVLICVNPKPKG